MKAEDRKRLLREMIFYRRFEDRCFEAYMERKIGGFLHLYSGQEAVAMGVLETARVGHDYVITGYRDHVHALKCGASPKEMMAELFGKETGCSRGRGGSMHKTAFSMGAMVSAVLSMSTTFSAPKKFLATKNRTTVMMKPEIMVPRMESNGFFIILYSSFCVCRP